MKIFTVAAYRWGSKENHSYIVGVYSTEKRALEVAAIEEEFRGGKYECEVLEWKVDFGLDSRYDDGPMSEYYDVIKEIGL